MAYINGFEGVKNIAHPKISGDLLEIICSGGDASEIQKRDIEKISQNLGSRYYPEILFLLTYTEVDDPTLAEKICLSISSHRKNMETRLGRPIRLELAAMDYVDSADLEDKPIMENMGNFIRQMARQAITDSKTKAFSAEQLLIDMQKEIDRAYRYGITFSIILIDLDKFKDINDSYGHQTGDHVLQFFASLIIGNLRKLDNLYRFGGDEFIVLLPQTNIKGAGRISRKLLELLNKTPCGEIEKSISVSMGVAAYGSSYSNNYEKLIGAADQALYKAKAGGRNLIALSRDGKSEILAQNGETAPSEYQKGNLKINCETIVSGCAIGNIFIYRDIISNQISQYDIKPEESQIELERIRRAINSVIDDLTRMQSSIEKEINREHGAIFLVHKLILQDSSLFIDIENELNEQLLNGEIIVRDIFRRLEKRFLLFEDKERSEKAKDIRDIAGRVIKKLQGREDNILSSLPPDTILVSRRLLPSDTVFLDRKNVKAIITVEGSRGSHSAILARALNIPYVTIQDKIEMLPNLKQAIVDSDENTCIINPDGRLIEEYRNRILLHESSRARHMAPGKPLEYRKHKISLLANVSSREEAIAASDSGADGIGLFRMENIYLTSRTIPDERFLLKQFEEIFSHMIVKEITIRLVDIGSDKTPAYLDFKNEINPALGLRGIRFLLKHRNLLQTQLEACIRFNRKVPIKILLPMVSVPSEVIEVREIVSGIKGGEKIPVGAMIETPAAVFNFDSILETSDFISIGTNDLFQYTMAADRENKAVAGYFDMGFETLYGSIKGMIEKSRDAVKDCTICGEIAGDREYISSILKIGLTRFSVLPNLIPQVREEIMKCNLQK
ncbi:phosphoenolpyruvate--protein phosphotransferase [Spirochaeta isovalerica]|uniref:Phosphoenolpyruvate-protein phosphotransferase n=1 Tax=Spirochaeta isovalerica TaxID=150 RepID=A0A841R8S9_9SPIO|nr:phosphoenolpyruvate--protein phosphotransferase [Spirochaeta isovalerica]MBB6479440.1 phosphoenolpyruvate-protein phosphotransferase [Spirochaeta isovalerica]